MRTRAEGARTTQKQQARINSFNGIGKENPQQSSLMARSIST